MKLSDGIRKHGFRKWYERELLQSHAHLALTFLCVVGVFAAFEAAASFTTLVDRLTDAAALAICAVVGVWSMRRYLFLLTHAEAVAHQADCPACESYARFKMVAAHGDDGARVDVRCSRCAHEWTIES